MDFESYTNQLDSFIDLRVKGKIDENQSNTFSENYFTKQRDIFIDLCISEEEEKARSFIQNLDVIILNRNDRNNNTFLHYLFAQDENGKYILNGRVIIKAVRVITESTRFTAYDSYNKMGQTAFMLACRYGDIRVVRMLQPKIKEIYTNKKKPSSAFDLACAKGHLKVVKFLTTNFQNYRNDWFFENALYHAIYGNHPDVVQYLVDFCSNDPVVNCNKIINVVFQKSYCTSSCEALLVLADKIDLNILRCHAKGKQINVFFDICINGNLDLAKHLTSRRSFNFNGLFSRYEYSLIQNTKFGNKNRLIECLANIPAIVNNENYCSYVFNIACGHGDLDTVKQLSSNLKFKVSVWNKADDHKKTPLHHACESANVELVEWLLTTPAIESINSIDSGNHSPCTHVCINFTNRNTDREKSYYTIFKLLMKIPGIKWDLIKHHIKNIIIHAFVNDDVEVFKMVFDKAGIKYFDNNSAFDYIWSFNFPQDQKLLFITACRLGKYEIIKEMLWRLDFNLSEYINFKRENLLLDESNPLYVAEVTSITKQIQCRGFVSLTVGRMIKDLVIEHIKMNYIYHVVAQHVAVFQLMVFTCDGYLFLDPDKCDTDAYSFMKIATSLPMELQMKLIWIMIGKNRNNIPSRIFDFRLGESVKKYLNRYFC